jgi:hypothetical protein
MAVRAAPVITTSVMDGLLAEGGARVVTLAKQPAFYSEAMSDSRRSPRPEREPAPVERLLRERGASDLPGVGRPLSERARIAQRTVESYLLGANNPPRWMERVVEIDRRVKRERAWLAVERVRLRERFGGRGDHAGFARAWREVAAARDYRELNELIRQHNEWYPVERNLPVHPRTGEWVTAGGRSYLRTPLSAEWVLREFPVEG